MSDRCDRDSGGPTCTRGTKDIRPFEGIITDQVSDGLSVQTRLPILNWNAGLQRGKVTNSVVGPHHVILLQEAESHFHEIAAVRSWRREDRRVIPGTSKQ